MMNVKIDRVCWLTQNTFIPFCTQQKPDWSLKTCEVKAMTVCLPFLTEKAIGMMMVWMFFRWLVGWVGIF